MDQEGDTWKGPEFALRRELQYKTRFPGRSEIVRQHRQFERNSLLGKTGLKREKLLDDPSI